MAGTWYLVGGEGEESAPLNRAVELTGAVTGTAADTGATLTINTALNSTITSVLDKANTALQGITGAAPIIVSGTAVAHATATTASNASSTSVASGGNFTAVDSVTFNSYGHVTAINTKTVTIPTIPTVPSITGGTQITASVNATGTLVTVSHNTAALSTSTASTLTPAFGTTFAVVSTLSRDTMGHVTDIQTRNIQLPSAPASGNTVYVGTTAVTTVTGGSAIGVTAATAGTAYINHNTLASLVTTTANVTLAGNSTFVVLNNLTRDTYGHVSGVTATTYTMPSIPAAVGGTNQYVNLASNSTTANSVTGATLGVSGILGVANGGIGTSSLGTSNRVLISGASSTSAVTALAAGTVNYVLTQAATGATWALPQSGGNTITVTGSTAVTSITGSSGVVVSVASGGAATIGMNQPVWYGTSASDASAISIAAAGLNIINGTIIGILFTNSWSSSTTAMTLALTGTNDTAAKGLFYNNAALTRSTIGTYISTTQVALFQYNGTRWNLLNPIPQTGGGGTGIQSLTFQNGMTGSVSGTAATISINTAGSASSGSVLSPAGTNNYAQVYTQTGTAAPNWTNARTSGTYQVLRLSGTSGSLAFGTLNNKRYFDGATGASGLYLRTTGTDGSLEWGAAPSGGGTGNYVSKAGDTMTGALFLNGGTWTTPGTAYIQVNANITSTAAIYANNSGTTGLYGLASTNGVYGSATAANGRGVYGAANVTGGTGVDGYTEGASGIAVRGRAYGVNGRGMSGMADGQGGIGVYGSATQWNGAGVFGEASGSGGIGVVGTVAGSGTAGVYGGASSTSGIGVYGSASGSSGTGVCANNPSGTALYVIGFSTFSAGVKVNSYIEASHRIMSQTAFVQGVEVAALDTSGLGVVISGATRTSTSMAYTANTGSWRIGPVSSSTTAALGIYRHNGSAWVLRGTIAYDRTNNPI